MKRYLLLLLFFCFWGYAQGQEDRLDSSFAGKGWTAISFLELGNVNNEYGREVLVQQDGRYIVVFGLDGTMLARYQADGRLDSTFGINGFAVTQGAYLSPDAAVLQSDGKIVVAGGIYNYDEGYYYLGLARYNSDGSMDKSFGSGGIAGYDPGHELPVRALALQSDGKIVVAGNYSLYDGAHYSYYYFLDRYDQMGTPDSSFGTDGRVTADFGTRYAFAFSAAVQSDGKIVVAGNADNPTTGSSDFTLVRYSTDGVPDSSFGTNGFAYVDFGGSDALRSIAFQGDGKLVAGGEVFYFDTAEHRNVAVARLTSDGTPDSTFGTNAWAVIDFSDQDISRTSETFKIALQGDGGIVVAGCASYSDTADHQDAALARLTSDGTPDSTFGINGKVIDDLNGLQNSWSSVALQGDGRIVAVGSSLSIDAQGYSLADFTVARYHSDGSPDDTFNGTGSLVAYYPQGANTFLGLIARQSDGKLVAAGTVSYTDYGTHTQYQQFGLVRYNSDGTPDNSFGSGGRVLTDFGGQYAGAFGVALQGDGKIVASGFFQQADTTDADFAVARFNTDGSPDSSFGGDGVVMTDIGSASDYAYAVALQGDGKIVVAGLTDIYDSTFKESSFDFAVARYNTDGSLDEGFGGDGRVTTGFGIYHNDYGNFLSLQGDGKIVVVGYTEAYDPESGNYFDDFALARYNTDGSLDEGFDGDGRVMTDFGNEDNAYSVVLQSDGRIVAGGLSEAYDPESGNYVTDFALARYNTDGSLDEGFDGDGRVMTDFGESENVYSLLLQSDGRIIALGGVGGYDPVAGSPYSDFALARYTVSGGLDSTFGTNGLLTTHVGRQSSFYSSVWNNGELYATGGADIGPTSVGILAAYKLAPGSLTTWYQDSDGDGYGNPAVSQQAESQPEGYVSNSSDCDDGNASVHTGTTYYVDADGDGYGSGTTALLCATTPPAGYADNSADCDDTNDAVHPGATEVCDGVDNDCDGQVDEGVTNIYYQDSDGDGYGNINVATEACTPPEGYVSPGSDCDDGNAAVYPGAPEVCDGVDNDCDGEIDEAGTATTWYQDSDGDGYGNPAVSQQACTQPTGYVSDNTDCNDGNAAIHPGAAEVCDGVDNDCDGQVDEGLITTYYRDSDGDGYGNLAVTRQACSQPRGYVKDSTDCNDRNAAIHPGAAEACDGVDNNCDGQVDEGCATNPSVSISTTTPTVAEGGVATFTVSISSAPTAPVTVNYTTQDGSATSKGRYPDYKVVRGSVTFTPTLTSADITVAVNTDGVSETSETFSVVLSLKGRSAVLATIGTGTATVTITDLVTTQAANVQAESATGKFSATAYPNPTSGTFTLQLQSGSNTPASLEVTDGIGRVVETRAGVAVNSTLQLGSSYRPGVYYVHLQQGTERQTLRLVKQAQ